MATIAKQTEVKASQANEEANEIGDTQYLGGKKVRRRFKWRPYQNAPEQTKDAIFDFSRCTEEQVIILAMYGATVKAQALLRTAANSAPSLKVDPNYLKEIDVLRDIVSAASVKQDPIAAAILALRKAGASEEVIKAAAENLAKAKK
jgi:hypothetical protein